MKKYIFAFAIVLSSVNASYAFEPSEHINIGECDLFSGSLEFCAVQNLADCLDAANDPSRVGMLGRACQNEYFHQADLALNSFYSVVLERTKEIELEWSGTAYMGQEELLRQSQRAWLNVRDTTCELRMELGAVMSGRDSWISECAARLTVRRIDDLQIQFEGYLN